VRDAGGLVTDVQDRDVATPPAARREKVRAR
jgi:hypothetical protein